MKKGSFWHGTLRFQLRHFNLQSTEIVCDIESNSKYAVETITIRADCLNQNGEQVTLEKFRSVVSGLLKELQIPDALLELGSIPPATDKTIKGDTYVIEFKRENGYAFGYGWTFVLTSKAGEPSSDNSRSITTQANDNQQLAEPYVENVMVKNVDGKYRYFFNIKNAKWDVDYDLSVTMKTGAGMQFNVCLTPATRGSFYTDLRTGPSYLRSMGMNGVETFSYTLIDKKTLRKSGAGRISERLEIY